MHAQLFTWCGDCLRALIVSSDHACAEANGLLVQVVTPQDFGYNRKYIAQSLAHNHVLSGSHSQELLAWIGPSSSSSLNRIIFTMTLTSTYILGIFLRCKSSKFVSHTLFINILTKLCSI